MSENITNSFVRKLFTVQLRPCFSLPLPQVLRTHVMVRVGGGWDTLEHYLDKHDPCRCAAFGEITSHPSSSSYKIASLSRVAGESSKIRLLITSKILIPVYTWHDKVVPVLFQMLMLNGLALLR